MGLTQQLTPRHVGNSEWICKQWSYRHHASPCSATSPPSLLAETQQEELSVPAMATLAFVMRMLVY